jgi:hypothetical protein
MTAEEIKGQVALHNALVSAFYAAGIKPLADSEQRILDYLTSLGVKASADAGYLTLEQSGTQMVVSSACESVRKAHPEWFAFDFKRDGAGVISREDFHGTPREIAAAKSAYLSKHGLAAWEQLPATRAEAQRKSAIPSATMSRSEYLSLSFSDRSRLAGIIGADGVGRIMSRNK